MSKFIVVRDRYSRRGFQWLIEEVIPGQKPTLLEFRGTQAGALHEARRLNLYGRGDAAGNFSGNGDLSTA